MVRGWCLTNRLVTKMATGAALHENMAGVAIEILQVLDIARVSKRIEVDSMFIRLSDPAQNEVAADNTSTRYKHAHETTYFSK